MRKISVVIPTYNRLKTLARAVDSVLFQSCQDFDLWIVDDGSTDGTRDWVHNTLLSSEDQQDRIHYIQTANKGVSHARNAAIYASRSEWVALLDSDDAWMPNKLELQLKLAENHPHLPLIHGEEIWIRNGTRVNPMKKHKKSGGRIFTECVPMCSISPSTSLIRRSLFEEVGVFKESYPVCEDYELWLRITSRYDVGFIETPVITKYGGHEDQLSKKYVAMDYYRVRALSEYVDSELLSEEEKQEVRNVLNKKCDILLRGYERHNNMDHFSEVKSIANSLVADLNL